MSVKHQLQGTKGSSLGHWRSWIRSLLPVHGQLCHEHRYLPCQQMSVLHAVTLNRRFSAIGSEVEYPDTIDGD